MNLKLVRKQTLSQLSEEVVVYRNQIESAISFLTQLRQGEEAILPPGLARTHLGEVLTEVSRHIREVALAQERQNWINAGIADLGDVLRNKEGLDLPKLADEILRKIIGYAEANQGAIFLVSDTAPDTLEMLTCYAYGKKKHLSKTIGPGEGLAGQCVLERKPIYLRQIPSDYIKITSGLGEATPREVLVTPLMINDTVYGVLELASFTQFDDHKLDFLKRATEIIASSIRNARENDKIRALLEASQQQSEELRAQEEEMRQNMEELQATQEEMDRKNREVLRQAEEMKGVLRGINATMATIEFTPDGTVVTANDNFLSVMKCTLDEIKGRHHKMFVPDAIAESPEYRGFWKRLSRGEAVKGMFERVSLTGERVWLDAIYNPIRDENGQVHKVVKFATDVTRQHELLAESNGILSGVNATMATIEFKPDGTILTANANFLRSMQYELSEVKGKHHRMFVPADEVDSSSYRDFWKRLSDGEAFTGMFNRINANGEAVLLNAVYNPIRNASGNVVKVVKFATVTGIRDR